MSQPYTEQLLTLEEAADVLKVGLPTLHSLINRGLLTVRPASGGERLAMRDLLDFLRSDQARIDHDSQPVDQGLLDDAG